MTSSEAVRKYVVEHYIAPARTRGEHSVQVQAGDVHRELRWTNRVPSVCGALTSQKFQREAGVELIEMSRSTPSTTARYTYRLHADGGGSAPRKDNGGPGGKQPPSLTNLYGAGKDVLRKAGGAEAFLKAERADPPPAPWDRFLQRKGRSH